MLPRSSVAAGSRRSGLGLGIDSLRSDMLLLCLLALLLRITVAVVWTPPLSGDAADYLRLAESLAHGEGFRSTSGALTSWRPPLYPIFLALVTGSETIAGPVAHALVRICQALVSTASVLLIYFVASLWFGRTVGRISGLLTATSFAQIAAVSRFLGETIFVFLLLAGIALVSVAWRRGLEPEGDHEWLSTSAWLLLASGFCLGLATLAKGILLPFTPALALTIMGVALRGRASMRWTLLGAAALMVGFSSALGPWTLRNYQVHDAFVPVATQGGATLYAGNHPQDGYVFGRMAHDARTQAARTMTEVEASRFLTDMTVADWLERPTRVPRLVALKLLYFWAPADWEILPVSGAFDPTYAFIAFWAALALASGAMLPDRQREPTVRSSPTPRSHESSIRAAWMVWMPILYFLAVALVFYGSPRFRMPIEPLLSVVAAVGLVRVFAATDSRRGILAVGSAALVVLALGGVWGSVEAVVRSTFTTVGSG